MFSSFLLFHKTLHFAEIKRLFFCAVCIFAIDDENSTAPSGAESGRTFLALFGVSPSEFLLSRGLDMRSPLPRLL